MFNTSSIREANESTNTASLEDKSGAEGNKPQISLNSQDHLDPDLKCLALPSPGSDEIETGINRPLELGDGSVRIIRYGLYDKAGKAVQITSPEAEYFLHVRIIALKKIEDCSVGFIIRDNTGVHIYSTSIRISECSIQALKPKEIQDVFFKVCIPRVNFPYLLGIGVAGEEGEYFDFINDCILLKAESNVSAFGNSWLYVKTEAMAGHRWQA